MNISILGCGSFALALANIVENNTKKITLWSKFEEETNKLKPLYKNYNFTTNYEDTKNSEIIIIAIPIEHLETTIKEYKEYYNNQTIIIATKGINDNKLFASQIVEKYIKTKKIAVISGPTFAIDLQNKFPSGITLATRNKKTINLTYKALKTNYLDIDITNDIIGVQLCGATKNIIAILTGILNEINYPESTKALLLSKATKEIYNILIQLKCKKLTIITYSSIGDMIMTSTSLKSRNYTLGTLLGKNNKEEIKKYLENNTTEGYYTTKNIYMLLKEKNIKSDLINLAYEILYNNKDITELIKYLKTESNK